MEHDQPLFHVGEASHLPALNERFARGVPDIEQSSRAVTHRRNDFACAIEALDQAREFGVVAQVNEWTVAPGKEDGIKPVSSDLAQSLRRVERAQRAGPLLPFFVVGFRFGIEGDRTAFGRGDHDLHACIIQGAEGNGKLLQPEARAMIGCERVGASRNDEYPHVDESRAKIEVDVDESAR